MKRAALLAVWLAVVPSLTTAEENEEASQASPRESESPILSLLLLPANLLIKIASVLAPAPPPETRPDAGKSAESPK